MCGIMGYVRTRHSTPYTTKVMSALMAEIAVRGTHASGFATLKGDRMVSYKEPVPSNVMAKKQVWWQEINRYPHLLIGHSRWATHGDPKDNLNNHPFVSARWAVIHNGVLHETVDGAKLRGQCDSEQILWMLEKYGIEGTVSLMADMKQASYACLAIDREKGFLHVWRDSNQPCDIIDLTAEAGGVFIASTKGIITDALERVGLRIGEKRKVYIPRPGWYYSFPTGWRPKGWTADQLIVSKLGQNPAKIVRKQIGYSAGPLFQRNVVSWQSEIADIAKGGEEKDDDEYYADLNDR